MRALPVGRGLRLRRVPEMVGPRARPEVGIGIGRARLEPEVDGVVVAGDPPLLEPLRIERDDVDGDAEAAELFLDDRRHALAQVIGVGQDREPYRGTGGVFEHAVTVAIAEAGGGQKLARAIAVAGRGGTDGRAGRVPAPVGWRDRPEERSRDAEVDGVHDRLRSTPQETACRNSLRAIHGARPAASRAGRRLKERKSASSATLTSIIRRRPWSARRLKVA